MNIVRSPKQNSRKIASAPGFKSQSVRFVYRQESGFRNNVPAMYVGVWKAIFVGSCQFSNVVNQLFLERVYIPYSILQTDAWCLLCIFS